ncbi:fucolectin-5-like [Conger conger]|uniref:fucolectin-5-like n=1 Tax=Conger conger TaxID=82655 RepID=UPI002A5A162A|nr:fucolectin-5-like [Conger conger]
MKVKMMMLLFPILATATLKPDSVTTETTENVAIRGKATQSALFPGEWAAYCHASNAIDGNRDSVQRHGSCTHTTNVPNPWWRVDLLQSYTITSVTLTNRADCCSDRITGAQIRIGDSLADNGISNALCSTVDYMGPGETKTFNCYGQKKGRYVTVYIPKAEYLSLCEVEVNALVSTSISV